MTRTIVIKNPTAKAVKVFEVMRQRKEQQIKEMKARKQPVCEIHV